MYYCLITVYLALRILKLHNIQVYFSSDIKPFVKGAMVDKGIFCDTLFAC